MNTLRLNVAVIIPTYNRACFLREAIESALSQSVPPIGVYVVDDASTDDTPQLNQKNPNLSQKISPKYGHEIAYKSF
jgi:glycosyltransferase involved in cell wall biosynthesis